MATVNFTGYTQGSGSDASLPVVGSVGAGKPYEHKDRIYVAKSTVDTAQTGITNTNADVYEAIYLPAFTKVLDAWFEVTTPESTNVTAQFRLGITGGTTDGFVADTTCATAVVHATNASTYTAAGGFTAVAADSIDLLVSTAAFTDCVVDVYAVLVDMS